MVWGVFRVFNFDLHDNGGYVIFSAFSRISLYLYILLEYIFSEYNIHYFIELLKFYQAVWFLLSYLDN